MKESELREKLKEKGKSLRNVAMIINMPQGTMQNIIDRGIENTTVKNIKLVADYLGLSIDELVNETKEHESVLLETTKSKLNDMNDNDLNLVNEIINSIKKYR